MAGGGGAKAGGGDAPEITLEHTPTWIVAAVCSVIVIISLLFERLLHRLGKRLKNSRKKPLYEGLLKVKEELMLLGFISLLLTVFQGATQKICVKEGVMRHLQPCKLDFGTSPAKATAHFAGVLGGARRLLAGAAKSDYCEKKGLVPILSVQAIHQLHIFIFVLAVSHVVLSAVTVLLGIAQTRKWQHWESKIQTSNENGPQMIKHVQEFQFIKDHFRGHGKRWKTFGWLRSFFKQFYGSVTEEDYITMRLGFIMKHCRGNPKFNFYKYMIRALEADFKKVVGISWYLWAMLIIFLLLNVQGWYVYIWISAVPFVMLLVVGTKLEHIITELAHQVAEKHTAIEGELVVSPSDELFWFHRPKLVLLLIHIVLFQNAFEIAFFFWLLVTYGFNSCIMGNKGYVIARLVISVVSQLLCGYSSLPLYAIVSHMGTSFKKVIFDENVAEGLANWAQKARNNARGGARTQNVGDSPVDESNGGAVQMTSPPTRAVQQGTARLI
ncbi:MLO-like protein 1 [Oryza brachyantha]|uniref:MLO-like protein n=1 Tax=Oryza brachyantha TaxID=4533 RepID=J3LDX4_ORYBR|nr:MLO-like protein 1 [Oryza brachyantha]